MSLRDLTSMQPSTDAAPSWVKCPGCMQLVYAKRLAAGGRVCPECGHHYRLTARERLEQLTDAGSFVAAATPDCADADPLGFTDSRPYVQRLAQARARTGNDEAALHGTATVDRQPVVVAALDFGFMGGSMGAGVGEAVTRAAETAASTRRPLLLVPASGGARMQEGTVSLMQMAKTAQAMAELRERGVLSVSVVTDPTFGGVTASFAMLADVLIAEAGALLGFAGPRVIESTIRQRLPDGFQTAESLRDHGMLDLVVPRGQVRGLLGRLLRLYRGDPAATRPAGAVEPAVVRGAVAVRAAAAAAPRSAWETVRLARHLDRPTTLDYLDLVFDDFQELHGDRLHGDDPAVVGGPARLGGRPVMVVGHQKGHTTAELVRRNFGMPHPEGYRKARRLVTQAERLGLPVVTLVDTPGAYPGVEAEERGQAVAIAESILTMARLRVPVVSVITGEGGSGGALALAVANWVLVLEHGVYSVISPEGCAAILSGGAARAPEMAEALRITAPDQLELGVVDGVVPEPPGGAHTDHAAAAASLRQAIASSLQELQGLPPQALVDQRHRRFRRFGLPESAARRTGAA